LKFHLKAEQNVGTDASPDLNAIPESHCNEKKVTPSRRGFAMAHKLQSAIGKKYQGLLERVKMFFNHR